MLRGGAYLGFCMNQMSHNPRSTVRRRVAAAAGAVLAALAVLPLLAGCGREKAPDPACVPQPVKAVAKAADMGGYKLLRRIPTGCKVSRSLAVTADGKLFVVGDQAVHVIGPSGDNAAFELGFVAHCAAVSEEGLLYLGVTDHVEVTDHCGTPKAKWPTLGDKAVITSIAVGQAGVWVADSGSREVVRYDFEGRDCGRVARRTGPDDEDGLVVPSPHLDVAEDAAGHLWVANPGRHRLQVYDAAGKLQTRWGFFSNEDPAGFTGCCNPVDFALLVDGNVVAADKGALARVRVFTAAGKLTATLAEPGFFKASTPACTGAGIDVAADGQGRIYVLDPAANEVAVFGK